MYIPNPLVRKYHVATLVGKSLDINNNQITK